MVLEKKKKRPSGKLQLFFYARHRQRERAAHAKPQTRLKLITAAGELKLARYSESLPRKKLKWRETKFHKAQRETGELRRRNRSLTQEIARIERRIQDLCEDFAKNEIVHAMMRNSQIGAVPFLLGKEKKLKKTEKSMTNLFINCNQ